MKNQQIKADLKTGKYIAKLERKIKTLEKRNKELASNNQRLNFAMQRFKSMFKKMLKW